MALRTDPTPDATTAALIEESFVRFGFRVVISGPPSARAGESVSYMLEYQRLSPNPTGWSNGIVIDYGLVNHSVPPQPASSLVSVKAIEGEPPANLTPQLEFESVDLAFAGDSGKLEIVVRPAMNFSGPLTIKAYIKGTSIVFQSGSIDEVTTQIAPS